MLYLVTGEWVEPGLLAPPAQVADAIEQAVFPSFERLEQWEKEGKLKGGIFAGERAGAFVIEAASNDEIGEMVALLPFWGLVKWHVRPLQSVRSALERDRRAIAQLRAAPPA